MTDDEAVFALANEAGLEVQWADATGAHQTVGIDTLKTVLAALDLPAHSRADVADSRSRLHSEKTGNPSLIVAGAGQEVSLERAKHAEIELQDGTYKSLRLNVVKNGRASFLAPRKYGYYRIAIDERQIGLAVAPTRALQPKDLAPHGKIAAVSVQIYALRDGTSGAFGDYAALGAFARAAGRAGFDAVVASPTHTLPDGVSSRFSPYSPSTRLFFNPLFADATLTGGPRLSEPSGDPSLIDWHVAAARKHSALRMAFAQFRRRGDQNRFEAFCREGGDRLLAHALFETIDARFRGKGIAGFRNWPAGFDSPAAANVPLFAKEAHKEIEYQLFLQWISALSAERAQKEARKTMSIGIVADLPVGMDPQGSHAWSAPHELLHQLYVGAPPDMFQVHGQNWGLTTLSPRALRTQGFAPFIATLRAAVQYAGGVRLDHALGLRRLWVVPAGASPRDGAYLRYPERQMLQLIALESLRNRAIVVGEDLGTVPQGFHRDLESAGILGTQVLWFERRGNAFAKPSAWRRSAVATTTTHDLPTVAGWWTGRDIAWRKRVGHLGESGEDERHQRAVERVQLWTALTKAHCAIGDMPLPNDYDPVVMGALAYVARTPCAIAVAPIEDLMANREQPNLPGTIDEHPNWRRRVKKGGLFRDRAARKRVRTFLAARRKS